MVNKCEYKVPMENYTAIIRGIFELVGRDKTSVISTPTSIALSFDYEGAGIMVHYKAFDRDLTIESEQKIPAGLSQLVIEELQRKESISPIPEPKKVLDLEKLTNYDPNKK